MRALAAVLAGLTLATPAQAHDFWLHPAHFRPALASNVPVSIQVGHGADRAAWPVNVGRVLLFRSIGPNGAADRRSHLRHAGDTFAIPVREPGAYLLVLQTNHAESVLPSGRFNAFLKEEGLTPALEHRERTGTAGRPGREVYSRRAKALIQVGPAAGAQPHVVRPVGLSLEIVPERDPAFLRPGDSLPIRVLWEGKPLAGATVKLTDLRADAEPVSQRRTDAAGRTTFGLPRPGEWLLNVVWTQPVERPNADFDTTFSSFTFGILGRAR
jgi:uncharacterized GH25 family protein